MKSSTAANSRCLHSIPIVLVVVLLFHLSSDSVDAYAYASIRSGDFSNQAFKGPFSLASPLINTHHIGLPWYMKKIQNPINTNSLLMNWPLLQRMHVVRPISRQKKAIGALTKLYPNFWTRSITTTSAPHTAVRKEMGRASHFVHDRYYDNMFPLGLGTLGRRPTGRRLRWG